MFEKLMWCLYKRQVFMATELAMKIDRETRREEGFCRRIFCVEPMKDEEQV